MHLYMFGTQRRFPEAPGTLLLTHLRVSERSILLVGLSVLFWHLRRQGSWHMRSISFTLARAFGKRFRPAGSNVLKGVTHFFEISKTMFSDQNGSENQEATGTHILCTETEIFPVF